MESIYCIKAMKPLKVTMKDIKYEIAARRSGSCSFMPYVEKQKFVDGLKSPELENYLRCLEMA